MTDKEINAFKNRLKNYSFHVEKIKELESQVRLIWYDLSGVKGVGYEPIIPNTNQLIKELKRLDMGEKIDFLVAQINSHKKEIEQLDVMLNQIEKEDRELLIKKYINNYTYYDLSKVSYMSVSTLVYRIDKALEKVVYLC